MRRVVVVRIDDVARRAAAGAVIASVIVGARERKDRIEQARFLQAEEYGIGAQFGSKTAVAELIVGFARRFLAEGVADLALFLAASFENAQHISGLGSFPAKKRCEIREDAFAAGFFSGRRRHGTHVLRNALARIAFTETSVFVRQASIVVEGGAPK